MLNWNRINAQVCFNYLQQEFYLVKSTMKTLAQGKSQTAILKLCRILIITCQSNFGDLNLDDACIRDIADVITADLPGDIADSPASRANSDGVELKKPRGAILTRLDSDHFYDVPKPVTGGPASRENSKPATGGHVGGPASRDNSGVIEVKRPRTALRT